MAFYIKTLSCDAGDAATFDFSDLGSLGRWTYGISRFALTNSDDDAVSISNLSVTVTASTDGGGGTITLTPNVVFSDQDVPFDLYEGTLGATVDLTVIAWVNPAPTQDNPGETPSWIRLGNASGLSQTTPPDPSQFSYQGVPRAMCGSLAGFSLAFTPDETGSLYGLGAAAGLVPDAFATATQARPVWSTQAVAGDNDDLVGVGDEYQGGCSVDASVIVMTTTSETIAMGFEHSHMASSTSPTLTPTMPASLDGRDLSQAVVLLQSFYVQFRITGDNVAWDEPLLYGFTVGASDVEVSGASFSFTSTTTMSGIQADDQDADSVSSYGANYVWFALAGPTLSSADVTSGGPGAQVTLTGTNLIDVEAVWFGDVLATAFTARSDTSVVATVPDGSGVVDVRVVTAAGSSPSGSVSFSYDS